MEEPLKLRRADFSSKLLFSGLCDILNPATMVRRSCQQSAQSPLGQGTETSEGLRGGPYSPEDRGTKAEPGWNNKCGSGSYPGAQPDSRRATWGHAASRHLKALTRVAEEGAVAGWGTARWLGDDCPSRGPFLETQGGLRLVVVNVSALDDNSPGGSRGYSCVILGK